MLEFIRSFYRKNQTKFNSLIKISNRNVEALTEVPVKTKRLGSVHASNLGIPVTEAGLPIPQEKKYFYVDGKLIRIRIKLDDGKEVYLIISYYMLELFINSLIYNLVYVFHIITFHELFISYNLANYNFVFYF